MNGLLVSFEGLDNCGKTTQITLLERWLVDRLRGVSVFREPGSTGVGESVRELLLHRKGMLMTPMTQNLLFMASMAQGWAENVVPALQDDRVVIMDRFTDSALAYQGYGAGVDLAMLKMVHKTICCGRKPDVTFLLDIPVSFSQARQGSRERDRFESAAVAYHEKVRAGYLAMAQKEPRRIKVIDGTMAPESVALVVQGRMVELLNEASQHA